MSAKGAKIPYILPFHPKRLKIPLHHPWNTQKWFPEKVILRDEYENTWVVKLERIENQVCFAKGWPRFVEDNHVGRTLLAMEMDGPLEFSLEFSNPNTTKLKKCIGGPAPAINVEDETDHEEQTEGTSVVGEQVEKIERGIDEEIDDKSTYPKKSDEDKEVYVNEKGEQFEPVEENDRQIDEEIDDNSTVVGEQVEKIEREIDEEIADKSTYSKESDEDKEVYVNEKGEQLEPTREIDEEIDDKSTDHKESDGDEEVYVYEIGEQCLKIRRGNIGSTRTRSGTFQRQKERRDYHDKNEAKIYGYEIFELGTIPRPKNPYFVTGKRIGRPQDMFIPHRVVQDYTLQLPEKMILRDSHGKAWETRKGKQKDRVVYTGGWGSFWQVHDVKKTDRCICEIVKEDGKALHFYIYKVENGI